LKRLESCLYGSVINDSFCRNIRTENDFEYHARLMLPQMQAKGQVKLDAALTVLDAFHAARSIIFSLEQAHGTISAALVLLEGLRRELSRLVPETFLDLYGNDRLIQIVRYIRTISIRAQKGLADLVKDQKRAAELNVYQAKLESLLSSLSPATSTERRKAVEDFFWSMEEYKVSLFAQELKTLTPVSPKRLDAKLREIERLT